MLRKYLKKAEIGRASIHTLRHTFWAHHIAKGTSLATIQDVMGLKDGRSTSIYISLAQDLIIRELHEHAISEVILQKKQCNVALLTTHLS